MAATDDTESWWERGPVLADHERRKKKLVPPLMRLPQTRFVSTLDQIFPEIFWMCLIFQDVGPHRATRTIIPALEALYKRELAPHWYRTSTLLAKPDLIAAALQGSVDPAACAAINRAISLLVRVYGTDEAPSDKPPIFTPSEAMRIEQTVRTYWDKSTPEYCSVLATCIIGLGVAGKGHYPSDMLKGVNTILESPGSDEAEATSSMLRAASMAMFPMEEDDVSRQWCRRFWNTNYRLSACELRNE